MAIRKIITVGDDVLNKKCREVDAVDEKVISLLNDLRDTLKEANGVGLAAPQVGILKRIAVIDLPEEGGFFELINPSVIEFGGSQTDSEGCLSFPGQYGEVERPIYVKVKTLTREGKWVMLEGERLFARAVFHEIDHLDGKMFMRLVKKWVDEEE